MMNLTSKVTLAFSLLLATTAFGDGFSPKNVVASANGRAEQIGNHTDYNGGLVAAMALEEDSQHPVEAKIKLTWNSNPNDRTVRIISYGTNGEIYDGSYQLGAEISEKSMADHAAQEMELATSEEEKLKWKGIRDQHKKRQWLDYFKGVTATMNDSKVRKQFGLSREIPYGFTIEMVSDVPFGAGVSSSAAIQVAQVRALRDALSLNSGHGARNIVIQNARLAQMAERFTGANPGLMDQLTISASRGKREMIFMSFADPENPTFKYVPLDPEMEFVVFNSGVQHSLSDSHGESYITRRNECEASLRQINAARKSRGMRELNHLSELRESDLAGALAMLDSEKLKKRVTHVVLENERVREFEAALQARDFKTAGKALWESGASSRDLYQVTVAETDALVDFVAPGKAPAVVAEAIYGARGMGGGFGGSVLYAVKRGKTQEVAAYVGAQYSKYIAKRRSEYERAGKTPPKGSVVVGDGSLICRKNLRPARF